MIDKTTKYPDHDHRFSEAMEEVVEAVGNDRLEELRVDPSTTDAFSFGFPLGPPAPKFFGIDLTTDDLPEFLRGLLRRKSK